MAGRKGSGTKVQLSTGTVRLTRLDLASVQLAGVWRGAPTLSTSQLDWTGNIDPGVYVLGGRGGAVSWVVGLWAMLPAG